MPLSGRPPTGRGRRSPLLRPHTADMRSSLLWTAFLLSIAAGPLVGQDTSTRAPSTSEFPRTWDEEALRTLELPNVLTGEPARPVSADFYYAIPARKIYRTYPIYFPGRGPEGHLEDLSAREPEIVMGPGDDFEPYANWSDEQWIEAGKEVYRTPLRTFPFPPPMLAMAVERSEELRLPAIADGRIPFMRVTIHARGEIRAGGLSCAECHTRVMPDGSTIDGAQGNYPFDRNFSVALARLSPEQAPARITGLFGAPASEGVASTIPDGVDGPTLAAAHRAIPPGVAARHGTSSFTPVQIPDLIGVKDRFYLDRTGLQRHRDIGDMMRYAALNQGMDRLSSWAGYVPEAAASTAAHAAKLITDDELREELAAVKSPENRIRYSDPQLYALAKYLYSLEPPENPNPVTDLSREGGEIFELECADCHPAPLYTSNQLVPAPGFTVPDALRTTDDIRPRPVGTDPQLTLTTRRGTGFYKIPSLKGLWYRGPFSHDGSVATLEDWFDPRRLEDDYVPTGWNPGGGARAVRGHEYGLDLSESDRAALIAYLKTL